MRSNTLRSKIWTLLVAVLPAIVASPAVGRTWKSADGKYTVEADFVKVDGGNVTLENKDGKRISVPLNLLSDADQQFIKSNSRPATNSDDEKQAKEILAKKGLRVISSGLSLEGEFELNKQIRDSSKFRRDLLDADKELAAIEARAAAIGTQITRLTQANVQLNAQLARVGAGDATLNNKFVGAINANVSQVQLLTQQLTQIEQQVKAARSKANQAREAYIEHILNMRKLADSVSNQYAKLATDQEVIEATAKLSGATGESFEVGASPRFKSAQSRLKSLEDSILSEKIPLRRSNGGLLVASVVIDGKHNIEMSVDSGSSLICLPRAAASKCGIEVTSQDPEVTLELADGSKITANLVTISSVRVGKFTVEDVSCAVLGAEAVNAEPLLGMSFLGHFKFELNSQEENLTMVKVETGGTGR